MPDKKVYSKVSSANIILVGVFCFLCCLSRAKSCLNSLDYAVLLTSSILLLNSYSVTEKITCLSEIKLVYIIELRSQHFLNGGGRI